MRGFSKIAFRVGGSALITHTRGAFECEFEPECERAKNGRVCSVCAMCGSVRTCAGVCTSVCVCVGVGFARTRLVALPLPFVLLLLFFSAFASVFASVSASVCVCVPSRCSRSRSRLHSLITKVVLPVEI